MLVKSRRIDYYDDPEAPKANSLVSSVNVVVTNSAGDILLIRRTGNGSWALPGGAIDLGESVARAAIRETLEESGIECSITGIVGPLGVCIRDPRVHDGAVDAHPHQRLPGMRQAAGRHLRRASGGRVGRHLEQVAADVRDQLKLPAKRCDVAGERLNG